MKRFVIFFLILSVFAPCLYLSCGTVCAQPLKIGILLPLSGKMAMFGETERNAFLMAADEINAAGGLDGKKIVLVIEDTAGNPGVGRAAIEKLVSEDKVVIFAGGCSSSVTWEAAATAQNHQVPFLITTASADKITEQGWDYIFRLSHPISEHVKALASFLAEVVRPRTAAIFHEKTPFGQYGLKNFLELKKRLGLKVVLKRGYEPGEVDFSSLLGKAVNKKPDLINLISSQTDAAFLLQQARELNLNPKIFVGFGAGFTQRDFQEYAGELSEFVVSTALWTPSLRYPGTRGYHDKFVAKYNAPTDYHGAQAYAAMYVIADALKRAESLTPKDARDALAETDLMTVFGPVKFVSYGKKTQQNSVTALLVQWLHGNLEIVWPKELATAKFGYPVPKWNER